MNNFGKYPHIAARVFDTPLLIEQSKLVTILNVLGPRLDFEPPPVLADAEKFARPEAHIDALFKMQSNFEQQPEGHFRGSGVGVIPIFGTLVQRSDWMTDVSGMTSYDSIERMFAAAIDDQRINEIILQIDSPGGEVSGAFDTADRMVAARGIKPITAVATEFAASAAFLLASVADEIVVPRTGAVGSVGVVAAHFDYSKQMDKRGVAVTFIYAGEKKIDGNPFQPLSEAVLQEWGNQIAEVYKIFVDTVSRNRNMSTDRVRESEAGIFMGFKAVDAGLADRVNSFSNELNNAVLRKTRQAPGGPFRYAQIPQQETHMHKPSTDQAPQLTAAPNPTQSAAAAAPPADNQPTVVAAAADDSRRAQEMSGRERIKAILADDEAQGREDLAKHLAFETNVSADEAKAILLKSNKRSSLSDAMAKIGGGPGITSQEVVTDGAPSRPSIASSAYDHRRKVTAAATGREQRSRRLADA